MSRASTGLSREERTGAIEDVQAMTIKEFCIVHRISPPTYFKLRRAGLGPDEMRFGAVIRISSEAAKRWRAAREKPSRSEATAIAANARAIRKRSQAAAERSAASSAHVSAKRRGRRT